MDIKYATNDPQAMAQDGYSILRSLQNNHLPIIDILVRESIQNSLDAYKVNSEEVLINFKYGLFDNESLAKNLQQVEKVLLDRYGKNMMNFVSISDKNTLGLVGDYSPDSVDQKKLNKSNYHKLVFGIGKNQENNEAGGSWGLGKTSFFRLGIGIVFYYSRVYINGSYEERLIGSLIEDNRKTDRLLFNSNRGIAWWGKLKDDYIYPIFEQNEIDRFLKIFSLERYDKDETGTTIIIPYVIPENLSTSKYEIENIENQLYKAVLKWFFPRLNNRKYSAKFNLPYARVYVNSKLVKFDDFLLFEDFSNLYNAAITSNINVDPEIHIANTVVQQRVLLKETYSGVIAYKEVLLDDLAENSGFDQEQLSLILDSENYENLKNIRILAYMRKPGMVIEYDVNGKWLNSSSGENSNVAIFAVFVPNSDALMTKKYVEKGFEKLENYLRSVENADHASWKDTTGHRIVDRMQKECSSIINKKYNDKETNLKNKSERLARYLGSKLMPQRKIGNSSTDLFRDIPSKSKGKPRRKRSTLELENKVVYIDKQTILVGFKLFIKREDSVTVSLGVESQDGFISYKEWSNTFSNGTNFPFTIENVRLIEIKDDNKNKLAQSKREFLKNSKYIKFSNLEYDTLISGKFEIAILDKSFSPYFKLESYKES